ncbi:MAG TPA: UDP-glucose 4-epimerase GalE [Myxococcota bacterium]|nr:UDP-glucose 4-epimerase GalE [Myxococcota bacterium]
MSVRVLVTGGAGYVGSHCARRLVQAGYEVVTLDRMTHGYHAAISGELVVADLRDRVALHRILARGFDCVLHFGARMSVAESAIDPIGYYDANVGGTLNLLEAMRAAGCSRLVFSSTCAVYGIPQRVPIPEETPFEPISVYGETKAVVERILAHARGRGELQVCSLRYFNAAGAAEDGSLGEAHDPETHLIPLALHAAHGGPELVIHGDDYPTPDGTCVRDYVHVEDLAEVHIAAVELLRAGGRGGAWNVGSGLGSSNREVIAAVERVTGRRVPHRYGAARKGDPPALVGDCSRATRDLGWTPSRGLDRIITDAWRWYLNPRYGPGAH